MKTFRSLRPLAAVAALLSFCLPAAAAPFAEWLEVPVPGGGTVRIWGEGDEYDAWFETEDGHALRVNDAAGRYEYVDVDPATGAYVGTGVLLGDEAGREALLAASGFEWIALSTSRLYVTGVGYAGAGSVGDFKATYAGGGYVAPVLSTIEDGGVPALDFGAGTFSITINNAVKDAWYTVYAADTVDGEYEAVLSEQADEDGLKTLTIPAPDSKPSRFVRIGVSEGSVDLGTGL